jgi:hypothetical protein
MRSEIIPIVMHPLDAAAAESASDILNRTRSRFQRIVGEPFPMEALERVEGEKQ